jgi:hypothetical protein
MPTDTMADDALSSARTPTTPGRTGFLFLVSYFLVFCALVLGATGGWHAYRDYVESTHWPAVAAKLSDCRIHTWYDSSRGRPRSSHNIECLFRYEVGNVPYVVKSHVGNTIAIVQGQINLTRPRVTLLSLRTWVERHPNGAVETIHYDPADAQNISLVGADDEVRWQTTGGYLQGR